MPKIATQCFVLRMAQGDQRCCPVHTIWDVRPFLDADEFVAVWPIHLYQIQFSKTRKIRDSHSPPIESLGRAIETFVLHKPSLLKGFNNGRTEPQLLL